MFCSALSFTTNINRATQEGEFLQNNSAIAYFQIRDKGCKDEYSGKDYNEFTEGADEDKEEHYCMMMSA